MPLIISATLLSAFNKRGQSEIWDATSHLKPSFRCRDLYGHYMLRGDFEIQSPIKADY